MGSGNAAASAILLRGARVWLALSPAAAMVGISLLPWLNDRGAVRLHTWIAAALCALLGGAVLSGASLGLTFVARRQHYMQALTQFSVFAWWSTHFAPVAQAFFPILIQVLLAYQLELLMAAARGRTWQGGFGVLPVVFSINLFLWFVDGAFLLQLGVVALCFVGKELLRWERDGVQRHVFNPSSFGLAVASALLLATSSTDLTMAREIATTQEATPNIWAWLFLVGLIVQVQFPVVLVTLSAALTCWLCGVLWLRLTGVYMFATTDIPAAVLLGMLLLITDPATSPTTRMGKVLFGALYGLAVFALFAPLEAWGSYGHFDKLLPVPILNLLVRVIDRRTRPLGARLGRWFGDGPPGLSAMWRGPLRENALWVSAWAASFALLSHGDAFGGGHPGRAITFWQDACEQNRLRACQTYFDLLSSECLAGQGKACHNLGVEVSTRGGGPSGRSAAQWFKLACEHGVEISCALAGQRKPPRSRPRPRRRPRRGDRSAIAARRVPY